MIGEILKTFMSGDSIFLTLSFYAVIIALYASFVFAFYRFLGKRKLSRFIFLSDLQSERVGTCIQN